MKHQKLIQTLLVVLLISQLTVLPALAQNGQEARPAIAFLDPAPEITITEKTLGLNPEIQILNQAAATVEKDPLTINIDIIGLEGILEVKEIKGNVSGIEFSEGEGRFSLGRGELGVVVFSIRKTAVKADKLVSGFIVFGSMETGDFIYKKVTIDTRRPPATAESGKITLLDGEGDISLDWTDLRNYEVRFPISNSNEVTATIKGNLQFLEPAEIFTSTVDISPGEVSELTFGLGADFIKERGSHTSFLILRGPDDFSIAKKVTLHYPSSESQAPSGPKLGFLNGEEPLTLLYSELANGSPFQVGLANQGQFTVTITSAEIILLGVVDQEGKRIDLNLKAEIEDNGVFGPFETKVISITLTTSDGRNHVPRDGDYNGYLLLKTDLDKALIVKSITLKVAAVAPTLPTYLDRATIKLQVLVQRLTKSQSRFGDAEWAILALIAVIVLWAFCLLIRKARLWWWNARGRLGPIVVEEIADKPDLTARLRQHLARCGVIPATAVPNAEAGIPAFVTVVSESKLPQAKFVKAILDLLANYLRVRFGYIIACILVGNESKPPVGVTVQIKMSQSGEVKRIETLEAATYDQAIQDAAYFIFHYISGRRSALRHIPEWSRFPSHTSYRLYKEADQLKKLQKYSNAIKLYEEAAKETPFNALLRLGWGDAYEMKREHLKALYVYLEALAMWPHLYGFWYRVAVNLSYADIWLKAEFKKLKVEKKEEFLELLNKRLCWIDKNYPPLKLKDVPVVKKADVENTRQKFLERSLRVSDYLDKQTGFWKLLGNWFSSIFTNLWRGLFQPAEREPLCSKYYWGYIPLLWSFGVQFRRMNKIALYCTELRQGSSHPDGAKEIESVSSGWWNRWYVYYNVACYYALSAKDECALEFLKKANRDPHSYLDVEWVKIDPDLERLHVNLEFKALFDIPDKKEAQSKEAKEIIAKTYALRLVKEGASQQMTITREWGKSQGLDVSPEELLAGAQYKSRLWNSLLELAKKPADETVQKLFWNSVTLHSQGYQAMPDKKTTAGILTLDELDRCWKAIQDESQHLPGVWEAHAGDCKLFLEHGKPLMSDVWALWRQAEIRQWTHLEKLIKPLGNLEVPPGA